ncbi:MAG: hypothetical protein ACOC33_00810 [bacterium]
MNIVKSFINKIYLIINKDIDIDYNKQDEQVTINIKSDINLCVSGQFNMFIDGELNIITNDNKLCLDSLNNKIYLNSKAGNIFDKKQVKRIMEKT